MASAHSAPARWPPRVTSFDAHGRLDVVVHNAGHMVLGPSEAFTSRVDMTAAAEPHSRRCDRGGNLPVTDLSTVALDTPEVVTRKWSAMSSPAALGFER